MHKLKDRTLIITGASMGVGRALALGLAREGVHLVLNARSSELLEEAREECLGHGARASCAAGDIAEPGTVSRCITKARELGNIYGFIHNAGALMPGPLLWEMDEDAFSRVMDSHVKASHQLIRQIVPLLLEQNQGMAVFLGSGAAERTQPGIGAYCAAKAAEELLARQLAAETSKIISLVFRPGIVDTRMQEQARTAQGGGAEHLHRVFRPWKERGELLTPEQSAESLIRLLNQDPWSLHGKTFRAGE